MQVECAGHFAPKLMHCTVLFAVPQAGHAPLTQPFGHGLPQDPQFFGSVRRLVQLVHTLSPIGQAQTPFEHAAPGAQTLPQPPQFSRSVCVSEQPLAQSSLPVGQPQTPALQSKPPGQSLPQPAQFFGSLIVSTQAPLHALSPGGHPQVPAVQAAPGAQGLPHAPQFAESLAVSTQSPWQEFTGGQAQAPASQT